MNKSECCPKCGSESFQENPTVFEYDDGTKELNHDTLKAVCNKCSHDWLIVYI